MIATLSLVYVDTTSPVTEPGRADIVLAVGESTRIRCTLRNSAGTVVDLTGKTLVYAATRFGIATPMLYRALTPVSDAGGIADLVIASSDTLALAAATYAGGATFATPVVPDIGAAYTGGSGSVSIEITAYTTTGFTVVASAAFTGSVPYTVIGASA